MKPLGHKAYGHIAHFSGSRMTPADKHCHEGQQRIMTDKTRDWRDLIIVQEKVDGSNCSIARIDNKIVALTRSGYLADTSPYKQHHHFSKWVALNYNRFWSNLSNGERIVGEWMLQAHGTRYNLIHEPFVAFDIMTGHDRLTYVEFLKRIIPSGLPTPRLIHIGQPMKLKHAIEAIKTSGHGSIDPVEGVVYRCERLGKVDFLCKWVRPDKEDGKYLPEQNGGETIWNLDPDDLVK